MKFLLITSKRTGEILKSLQKSTGLTWNVLARIAVALSLEDPTIPPEVPDTSGVEIHRNSMTGEHDYVYKVLIRHHAGYNVPEEDYFPGLFNCHLERGIRLLEVEYKTWGNYQRLITNLLINGN